MKRAILCGVSARGQQKLHEGELRGLSSSSVSRLWQRKAVALVEEMMGRNLGAEPVAALIAFHRLEVPSTLNKTFLSTNCIETILNLRRHIGRVCRWRSERDHPERWVASGLRLAQMGFNKISGYKDMPALIKALKREEKEVAA